MNVQLMVILNETGTTSLVKDNENGNLYVRKTLAASQKDTYKKISKLNNCNIPKVIEIEDVDDDLIAVYEEYLDGITYEQYLINADKDNKAVEEDELISQLIELCDTISKIHEIGVIHRDIKPSNVIFDKKTNKIMLVDFGIARMIKSAKTKDTMLLGTEGFAAPEQFGFGQSDERTDIYAVGAFANYALTRQFPGECMWDGDLEEIIRHCVEINPRDRFQTALEVKEALIVLQNKRKEEATLLFKSKKAFVVAGIIAAALLLIVGIGFGISRLAEKDDSGSNMNLEKSLANKAGSDNGGSGNDNFLEAGASGGGAVGDENIAVSSNNGFSDSDYTDIEGVVEGNNNPNVNGSNIDGSLIDSSNIYGSNTDGENGNGIVDDGLNGNGSSGENSFATKAPISGVISGGSSISSNSNGALNSSGVLNTGSGSSSTNRRPASYTGNISGSAGTIGTTGISGTTGSSSSSSTTGSTGTTGSSSSSGTTESSSSSSTIGSSGASQSSVAPATTRPSITVNPTSTVTTSTRRPTVTGPATTAAATTTVVCDHQGTSTTKKYSTNWLLDSASNLHYRECNEVCDECGKILDSYTDTKTRHGDEYVLSSYNVEISESSSYEYDDNEKLESGLDGIISDVDTIVDGTYGGGVVKIKTDDGKCSGNIIAYIMCEYRNCNQYWKLDMGLTHHTYGKKSDGTIAGENPFSTVIKESTRITCQSGGYINKIYCKECNKVFSAGKSYSTGTHVYTKGSQIKCRTCNKYRYEYYDSSSGSWKSWTGTSTPGSSVRWREAVSGTWITSDTIPSYTVGIVYMR